MPLHAGICIHGKQPVARDALPVGQVANQPEHRVAVLAAADRNQYFIELSEVENPADETELRPLRRIRLETWQIPIHGFLTFPYAASFKTSSRSSSAAAISASASAGQTALPICLTCSDFVPANL